MTAAWRAFAARALAVPPGVRGCLWMLLSIASFVGMTISGRELSTAMSTFEVLFFRSLVGAIVMLPLVIGDTGLATARKGYHFTRNLVHFSGQVGWFYGVAMLPLADLTALSGTVPIFGAVIALVVLKERVGLRRAAVIALGFSGVLVMLRPGFAEVGLPAFAVLFGSAMYAAASIMVKIMTRTDNARIVVFYMQVMQLPMALLPALLFWTDPAWADLPAIVGVGVCGLGAHYFMARALTIADASVVMPMSFLQLPVMAVLGYLLYAEIPDVWMLVGGGMVLAGTWWNVRAESRRTA